MYSWIWRHLPGSRIGRTWLRVLTKLAGCLVLFLGVVVLLFLVVFPQVEPRLPWEQTGVNSGSASVALTHLAGARR